MFPIFRYYFNWGKNRAQKLKHLLINSARVILLK